MKFALIQSSFEDFYSTPHRLSALGLHLVQEMLQEEGHTSQLFLFGKEKERTISLPKPLAYLKEVIEPGEKGETAFFTQYKRFGPSTVEMVERLSADFDGFFLSVFAYAYADTALQLALALQQKWPKKIVVLGGAGATVNPSYFLKHNLTVLAGEAESSLPLFLQDMTLTGLIKGEPSRTPRAVLAPVERGVYAFSFLRGCHHQCKFCSQRLTHGMGFRVANWQQMLACFDKLEPKLEKIYINFEDDNLLDAKELWFNLLQYLKNRYPNAQFGAENGLNYSQLDTATLNTLAHYGFKKFNLSLAVSNTEAREQKRFYAPKQLEEVLHQIKALGSTAVVYFIAGLQHSNLEQTLQMLFYLHKLPCLLGISPFYAVPGLEGFETDQLKQTEPLFFRASSLYPWTASHSPLQLATAFRFSRTLNFLKNHPTSALAQTIIKEKSLFTLKQGKIVPLTDRVSRPSLIFLFLTETEFIGYNESIKIEIKRESKMQQLTEQFIKLYSEGGNEKPLQATAPGRVNLIGEYTDFNGGYVLPCALTFGTNLVIRKRADNQIQLASTNFDLKVNIEDYKKIQYKKEQDWGNYPLGIAYYLHQKGYKLGGFEALFAGSIPNGAGLSSSASIEMVTAVALNHLFKLGLSQLEMVQLSQYSENNFNGVNCGIMDQFSIGFGKVNCAVYLNCNTLQYQHIPLNLGDYRLVIGNTNKRRGLADSKYNERRAECDEALASLKIVFPKAQFLCDLSYNDFEKHGYLIKNPLAYRRAKHVISENERILQATQYLQQSNLMLFGQLLNRSHISLQEDFEVSCLELDTLVALALKQEGVLGSRMTGAGFGGCTVSLVHKDHTDKFIKEVTAQYQEKIGYSPTFYVVEAGDGARVAG